MKPADSYSGFVCPSVRRTLNFVEVLPPPDNNSILVCTTNRCYEIQTVDGAPLTKRFGK